MATNLPFLEQISKKAINSFLKIQVSMNIKIPHFRTHLNEEVHHAGRWSEHHLSKGKQKYNFSGLHSSECSDCGYVILYVQTKRVVPLPTSGVKWQWWECGHIVHILCPEIWLRRSPEEERKKSPVWANKKGEHVRTNLPFARQPG